MTMSGSWQPSLAATPGLPLYARLVEALARDVAAGALAPGHRLPTQRALADRLGLSLGTVTKAYAEAERRGLLTGQVGRGSFVAGPARLPALPGEIGAVIDLSLNLPPLGPTAERLGPALARLQRRADLAQHLAYPPLAGFEPHRRTAADWLARCGFAAARWQDLVICSGAQHAMSLAFAALCAPGEGVFTEAATYHGMKALAAQAGLKLHGLPMDAEGLLPEALDRAAAKLGRRARVVYLTPTLQNPTARVMGAARRAEIVRVIRRRDLWLVEDEIHLGLHAAALPSLASLAPERSCHVSGMSKLLGPGLRVGFLTVPPERHDRVLATMRATSMAAPPLSALVVCQWIEDGTAAAMLAALREEAAARVALARRRLGRWVRRGHPPSLHLWLELGELEAERVAGRALRAGVAVTPADAPIVDRGLIAGLRVCIGAPADRASLDHGLQVLAAALANGESRPDALV